MTAILHQMRERLFILYLDSIRLTAHYYGHMIWMEIKSNNQFIVMLFGVVCINTY